MHGTVEIRGTRIEQMTALRTCLSQHPRDLVVRCGSFLPASVGTLVHVELSLEAADRYLDADAEEKFALVIQRGDRRRSFTVEELDALLDEPQRRPDPLDLHASSR